MTVAADQKSDLNAEHLMMSRILSRVGAGNDVNY